jgi:hypothetical protein
MRIVRGHPPLFDEIDMVFGVAGKPVIFAYGDTIFNPMGVEVTHALHAHETVHSVRQGNNPAAWWRRYLDDPNFRLVEELLAHREEYDALCSKASHRNERRFHLKQVAQKLCAPLYGNLISYAQARKELKFSAYQ